MDIHSHLKWQQNKVFKNNQLIWATKSQDPQSITEEIYKEKQINYPKFFKMDVLSRAAFLACELLEPDYENINKSRIAVVLTTKSGCIEIDKKFEKSRKTIASPALFVYTLPNIMLGEICIRNGFKGEQMCSIEEQFNQEWFNFYVSDLMRHRETDACLFGHVEATGSDLDIQLRWTVK